MKARPLKPPRLGRWLAGRLLPRHAELHGQGDLEEIFHRIARCDGALKAQKWYWAQLWQCLPPLLFHAMTWRLTMIKNYVKIALRNMQRHKGYALINILGLALGLAVSMLIINFILFETSYDKQHVKSDRIFRLALDGTMGANTIVAPISSALTGPLLKEDFPEIEDAVRFANQPDAVVKYKNQQFFENEMLFTDAGVFQMFTLPLLKGDPETALKTAYSIVISREIAHKYFGQDEALGQVLMINDTDAYTVTGVMEDLPRNTHLRYNMLCSMETLYAQNPQAMAAWTPFNYYTYVLLRDGVTPQAVEAKLPALVEHHMAQLMQNMGSRLSLFLQPLTSIHLHSHLEYDTGNGNVMTVYIFAAIALVILAIAAINFMNLATARSAKRAREVGIRKVLGSERKALVTQFLGESLVYALGALLLAFLLLWLSVPLFESISGMDLSMNLTQAPWLIPTYVLLAIGVGLAAGLYPALFLSGFQPVKVLKSRSGKTAGSQRFRNILVVIQFTISILLIISTTIITRQLSFMKTENLGFNKTQVLAVPILNSSVLASADQFKNEVLQSPDVLSVSLSSHVPGQTPWLETAIPEGMAENETAMIRDLMADEHFVDVMGLTMVKGRNFSKEIASDREESILINETAARKYGWDHPLGKTLRIRYRDQFITKSVIGVFSDFHMVSLHNAIEPMFIANENRRMRLISMRIRAGAAESALMQIKAIWARFDPNRPMQFFFLDQSFDAHYREEEQLNTLFSCFTGFAIFIACMGLFGLASFAAEQRTKEIGIRKVMGSSISAIILMLFKDFTQWVALANLAAWPLAYFLMRRWLEGFAYRIEIQWPVFLLSGLGALAVALLTVSSQAIKAATANPVKSLRWE